MANSKAAQVASKRPMICNQVLAVFSICPLSFIHHCCPNTSHTHTPIEYSNLEADHPGPEVPISSKTVTVKLHYCRVVSSFCPKKSYPTKVRTQHKHKHTTRDHGTLLSPDRHHLPLAPTHHTSLFLPDEPKHDRGPGSRLRHRGVHGHGTFPPSSISSAPSIYQSNSLYT